jgi:hypothetical protein
MPLSGLESRTKAPVRTIKEFENDIKKNTTGEYATLQSWVNESKRLYVGDAIASDLAREAFHSCISAARSATRRSFDQFASIETLKSRYEDLKSLAKLLESVVNNKNSKGENRLCAYIERHIETIPSINDSVARYAVGIPYLENRIYPFQARIKATLHNRLVEATPSEAITTLQGFLNQSPKIFIPDRWLVDSDSQVSFFMTLRKFILVA